MPLYVLRIYIMNIHESKVASTSLLSAREEHSADSQRNHLGTSQKECSLDPVRLQSLIHVLLAVHVGMFRTHE